MKIVIAAVLVAAFALAGTAQAHLVTSPKEKTPTATLKSQERNLAHGKFVCKNGAAKNERWHCKAAKWLRREWKETHIKLHPPQPTLNRYNIDSCLAEIINRETAGTWDPTIYNYSGSGAYGLPQALPGEKMASAGADWRTNPNTQVKWMLGYVNARYGGSCNALAFHNANGWY